MFFMFFRYTCTYVCKWTFLLETVTIKMLILFGVSLNAADISCFDLFDHNKKKN